MVALQMEFSHVSAVISRVDQDNPEAHGNFTWSERELVARRERDCRLSEILPNLR